MAQCQAHENFHRYEKKKRVQCDYLCSIMRSNQAEVRRTADDSGYHNVITGSQFYKMTHCADDLDGDDENTESYHFLHPAHQWKDV